MGCCVTRQLVQALIGIRVIGVEEGLLTSTTRVNIALAVACLMAQTQIGCLPSELDAGGVATLGSASFALTLANNTTVTRVAYAITRNGAEPVTGVVDVSDSAATVSFAIGGIHAGTGYLVELSANLDDGSAACVGQSHFDVVAGGATSVSVILQCRGTTGSPPGPIQVGGGIDTCPVITSIVASPARVAVGGTIALSADAVDADGDAISFLWTASGQYGVIRQPRAASTRFACVLPGTVDLSIAASDGNCSDSQTFSITCTSAGVGGAAGASGDPVAGGAP